MSDTHAGQSRSEVARAPVIVLICATLAMFVANVALLRHTGRLEAALGERVRSMVLAEGSAVPPLNGVTITGEPTRIAYGSSSERETLLFVLSHLCSVCEANWPYWQAIAEQVDPARYRIVYANISPGLTHDFIASHYFHPDGVIVAEVDAQSMVDYSMSLTPQVMLIDSSGTLTDVWLGMTREEWMGDMETRLSVDLGSTMAQLQ